jgi:hypothetical protein
MFGLLALALLLPLTACVSVNLGPSGHEKAKDYKFEKPAKPFGEIETENADLAWQSSKTGNTIALISECSKADPTLESIRDEILSAITDVKTLQSTELNYNRRKALRTIAQGNVDGVGIQIETLVFKKNECQFSLSYVGRDTLFTNEKQSFDRFTESFVVP